MMSPFSSGNLRFWMKFGGAINFLIFSCFLISLTLCESYSEIPQARVRRQTRGSESLLTVEWEGIQSGDHPDSSIRGFIVEYRAEEKDSQWNVHSGVIPYKGPNHQYRVQIPKLPTGISYFVRIKVLGEKNEVLVETPEIRARNEIVSIKCGQEPRNVDVKERGQYSVALSWQIPECGSIGEYQIELRGLENEIFDVHRQTVAQPSASITGLLSGTEYSVRIRAVDRSGVLGPWDKDLVTVSTKGKLPDASNDLVVEYRSNNDARIRWKHFDDERLQYYAVVLVELDNDGSALHVERTRTAPEQDNFLFTELKPKKEYRVGVIAYVDHEPRHIYRLTFSTNDKPGLSLDLEPIIVKEGSQHYKIHWKAPEDIDVKKFIVEYRSNNDSKWLRLSETRDFNDDTESYAVAAPEILNAFSVRIIFVDDEQNALARSKETLVNDGEGLLCNGVKGVVKGITVDATLNSLTYNWKKPECDYNITPIVGYEYSIWKQEDGQPPETTSFTEKESVTVENLQSNNVFLFRVRSRLTNGHSQWSTVIEGETKEPDFGTTQSEVSLETSTLNVQNKNPDFGAGGSFEQNELTLSNVQAQETGPKILVSWQVTGNPNNIEQKLVEEQNWRAASNYIVNNPRQFTYQEHFDHSALATNKVQLRVRAIGSNGQAIAVSEPVSLNASCKKIEHSPSDIALIRIAADSVILRWFYPNELQNECGLYFIISGTIDNASIQQTVDGQSREHRFDGNLAQKWVLQVAAVNRLGQGPLSPIATLQNDLQRPGIVAASPFQPRFRRSICDPRTDFWCRPNDYSSDAGSMARGVLVTTPTVSQTRDGAIQVQWRSTGNGRGVFGYRVLFRTDNTGWNPFGQIVPYVGDNTDYNLILTGLLVGLPYQVQIQVLDRNSYVLYTSGDVSAQSSCQPPSHPPTHLALDAPDSRHVRVTWNAPSQSTWKCNSIQYELQVDEPRGRPPVFVDGRQTSHVFDSEPDFQWTIRIRSVNTAGPSPWSTSLSTRSPPASELIERPFVTNTQGVPRLSWKTREGTNPDLIDHFIVEWRTRTEQRWNSHSNKVFFMICV